MRKPLELPSGKGMDERYRKQGGGDELNRSGESRGQSPAA